MFGRLLLIFVLVPLVELVLLNQLYQRTSLLTTVAVVLVTGVVGVNLARHQGMQAWKAIHQQMGAGQAPSKEILNGVMILVAGAFLITPGILTDGVGFCLLVPGFRQWLGQALTKWFRHKTVTTFQTTVWPDGPPESELAMDDEEQPSVRVVEPDEVAVSPEADVESRT